MRMHDQTLGATTPDQPDGLDRVPASTPYLFVVIECDRPSAGGAAYSLAGVGGVTIGRGTARHATFTPWPGALPGGLGALDLRLPSQLLSTNHVRISRDSDQWVLEDLGSRNGTHVNLRSLPVGERQSLHDGDIIELGRVVLRFRLLPIVERARPVDPNTPPIDAPAGFRTLLPTLSLGLHELARLSASPLPVLLLGETGTGKEVVARGIHELSGRPGPMVAVNCGALSGTLLDSQLFGHVKGSFTGALRDELGFVRASDGGTLFLDEIGDMPVPAQAALLRVLQEREVVPVGATRPVKVDLRIVAATHRQIDLFAARGDFRADLYARLSGHTYYLTPLRDRREDLGTIVAELLARLQPDGVTLRLSPDAGRALVTGDWPLNIRQLEQSLARAVTLAEDGVIHARQLVTPSSRLTTGPSTPSMSSMVGAAPIAPMAMPSPTPTPVPGSLGRASSRGLDDAGREAELRALLAQHHGNISEVARLLNVSRIQVHRLMQKYALSADDYRR
jgi:DNA-binding NtrC family response regulator